MLEQHPADDLPPVVGLPFEQGALDPVQQRLDLPRLNDALPLAVGNIEIQAVEPNGVGLRAVP